MAVTAYQRDLTSSGLYLCKFIADTAGELPTVGIAPGSIAYVVATDAHYGLHAGGWVLFSAGSAGLVNVLSRQASIATIANNTETAIYSYTIAAGLLGATDELRLNLKSEFLNNTGSSRGFTVRVKLGGSTVIDYTTGATGYVTGATPRLFDFMVLVSALGATNSQIVSLRALSTSPSGGFGTVTTGVGLPWSNAPNYGDNNSGSLSQDMTTSKLLEVTIQLSATVANLTWKRYSGTLEKLGT